MKNIRTWARTKMYRTKRNVTGWHVMNLTFRLGDKYLGYYENKSIDEIITYYASIGYTHYEIVGDIVGVDKRS